MDETLADRPLDRPSARYFSPKHPQYETVLRLHREAMEQGQAMYRDPISGFHVFTAKFLADRKFCCNAGCRHCPFVA